MKDIVIVPTFSRPEFLWICLERIAACPEVKESDVWIVADAKSDELSPIEETREVAAMFPQFRLVERDPHSRPGNSYNVLEAYREAAKRSPRFVFQIEDDVLVASDFFSWHCRMQSMYECFCSVACKNPHEPLPKGQDRREYLSGVFCSWGVCFPLRSVEMIVEHAVEDYYEDMQGYLMSHFPDSVFSPAYSEQDGLVERVMEKSKFPAVWPMEPRSQHCGWYGYHRQQNRPTGTLEERYQKVKEVLATPGRLEALCSDYGDLESLYV